ncbi:MAG: histidine triad nucleotide-binding protein [Pseudohongiellaceae bacterium]
MSNDCLFCKIISGDIPSNKVYSDDHVYAFHDINPAAPTHVLVIPRKHLSAVNDCSEEHEPLLGALMAAANRIVVQLGLEESGFRYVINTGSHGGQTVFHLHLHILGGRPLTWPPG